MGDGGLDLGALDNNIMIIQPLLLLDEAVRVPILALAAGAAVGSPAGGAIGGELDAGDEQPLRDGERDADERGGGDEDLGKEVGEDGRSHGGGGLRRWRSEGKGAGEMGREWGVCVRFK